MSNKKIVGEWKESTLPRHGRLVRSENVEFVSDFILMVQTNLSLTKCLILKAAKLYHNLIAAVI